MAFAHSLVSVWICYGQTRNKAVFSSAVHVGEDLVGAANGRRDDLSLIASPGGSAFQEKLYQ